LPLDTTLSYVTQLDKEVESIKKELLKICWYMRGGVSLDDAFALTYDERKIIGDIVADNLETTKKSGLPFF
jgi:hypothetical protein